MARTALALIVTLAAIALAAGRPGSVLAADPSATPSAEAPGDPNVEAWIDVAPPPEPVAEEDLGLVAGDAHVDELGPLGRVVTLGFTIWDKQSHTLSRVGGEVRVHPKTGKAPPSSAPTHANWPGHLEADVTVPKGGLGRIEVGFSGQACHDDTGTCENVFFPFANGGVGPPEDAPRSVLVDADIAQPPPPVLAGQPIDLTVTIRPRAEWAIETLGIPNRVVAIARDTAGAGMLASDLEGEPDGIGNFVYTGHLTIPSPGEFGLRVAFPGTSGAADDEIDRAAIRLTVTSGDEAAAATPKASGRGAVDAPAPTPGPPILPIALAIAAVIGLGLVVRRAFADL